MLKKLNLFLLFFSLFFCSTVSLNGDEHPNQNNAQTHSEKLSPQNPAQSPFDNFDMHPKDNDHFLSEFINMLATLAIIIILILIVSWFLKRMLNTRIQQINTTSDIKIIERRALTPKTTIYLLDIKGKGVALAESQNGVVLLSDLPVNAKSPTEPQPDFNKVLKEKMNERNP